MLRLFLPVVLLILGLGGGIGAGLFFGASPGSSADQAAVEIGDGAENNDGDDHDGEDQADAPSNGATEYVRLNNQFIVPIVHHGSVRSLVVMALTLEVDTGANGIVFEQEPRLRDAFLRVMFAHANAGGFDGSFTEAAAMSPLRTALGEAANSVLGETVHDVLIVDITRQDA